MARKSRYPGQRPFLTVVVPAYNEASNVPVVGRKILDVCEREKVDLELLFVDDGSTDETATRCRQLMIGAGAVRLVAHDRNRGLTAALRTGYEAAAAEWVTWLPADGQVDADQLPTLLGPIRAGEADFVISTYADRPDSPLRLLVSAGFRVVLRYGLGFGERLEGTYVFRRDLLDRIELVSTAAAGSIAWELAAKATARGARLASVEIECKPRISGESKVGARLVRNTLQSLREVWRIRKSLQEEGGREEGRQGGREGTEGRRDGGIGSAPRQGKRRRP